MDDAGSALLAIGARIDWQYNAAEDGFPEQWDWSDGEHYYSIQPMPTDGPQEEAKNSFGVSAPRLLKRLPFETFEAAKAACERHLATGKWE